MPDDAWAAGLDRSHAVVIKREPWMSRPNGLRVGDAIGHTLQMHMQQLDVEESPQGNRIIRANTEFPNLEPICAERPLRIERWKVPEASAIVSVGTSEDERFKKAMLAAIKELGESQPLLIDDFGGHYAAIGFVVVSVSSGKIRYTPDRLIAKLSEIPWTDINPTAQLTMVFGVPPGTRVRALAVGDVVVAEWEGGVVAEHVKSAGFDSSRSEIVKSPMGFRDHLHIKSSDLIRMTWHLGIPGLDTELSGQNHLLVQGEATDQNGSVPLDLERFARIDTYKAPEGKRLVHIGASDFAVFNELTQPPRVAGEEPGNGKGDSPWITDTNGSTYGAIGYHCVTSPTRFLRYFPDKPLLGSELPQYRIDEHSSLSLTFAVPAGSRVLSFGYGRTVIAVFDGGVEVK